MEVSYDGKDPCNHVTPSLLKSPIKNYIELIKENEENELVLTVVKRK